MWKYFIALWKFFVISCMKHRDCVLKGNKGYTEMDSSGFSMSLLVELSSVWVYGIMGWSSSVDNNVVRLFFTYLLSCRNQTPSITNSLFALVCDNASEHVWDKMAKFYKSSDVSIILIAPYFPSLNISEKKIIFAIKRNIEKMSGLGR